MQDLSLVDLQRTAVLEPGDSIDGSDCCCRPRSLASCCWSSWISFSREDSSRCTCCSWRWASCITWRCSSISSFTTCRAIPADAVRGRVPREGTTNAVLPAGFGWCGVHAGDATASVEGTAPPRATSRAWDWYRVQNGVDGDATTEWKDGGAPVELGMSSLRAAEGNAPADLGRRAAIAPTAAGGDEVAHTAGEIPLSISRVCHAAARSSDRRGARAAIIDRPHRRPDVVVTELLPLKW